MSIFNSNSRFFSVSRAVLFALVGTQLSIPVFAGLSDVPGQSGAAGSFGSSETLSFAELGDELTPEEHDFIMMVLNDEISAEDLPAEVITDLAAANVEPGTDLIPDLEEVSEYTGSTSNSNSPSRTSSTSPAGAKTPAKHRKSRSYKWTEDDDTKLIEAVEYYQGRNWKGIALRAGGKFTHVQCLQRWSKILMPGLKTGPWTEKEDENLLAAVEATGLEINKITNFVDLAHAVPGRTAKQVRERLKLNLDPSIEKRPFTESEDFLIRELHKKYGNSWVNIARVLNSIARFSNAGEILKNRTENKIKSRLKTLVRREAKEAKNAGKQSSSSASKRTRFVPESEIEQD